MRRQTKTKITAVCFKCGEGEGPFHIGRGGGTNHSCDLYFVVRKNCFEWIGYFEICENGHARGIVRELSKVTGAPCDEECARIRNLRREVEEKNPNFKFYRQK